MNALGKLLTVFVFLVSLVWLGFTAILFATRSDWKAEAIRAQKNAAEAQTSADTLTKQVIEERKLYDNRLSSADQNIIAIRKERNDFENEYLKLKASVKDIADQTAKLQPVLNEYQAVNLSQQNQTNNLTSQVSLLTTARDKAVFDQAKAEKEAADRLLQLNVTEKALQDQAERTRTLLEARQGVTEADADFRGDVISVGDKEGKSLDIITFSGGSNAGVKAGKRYVVTRAAAPYYIGTVYVIDASNPQYSSGVFTPAKGQKLAGDFVPKKGDTVASN